MEPIQAISSNMHWVVNAIEHRIRFMHLILCTHMALKQQSILDNAIEQRNCSCFECWIGSD